MRAGYMRKGKYYKHQIVGMQDIIYIKYVDDYKAYSGLYNLCKIVKMPEGKSKIEAFTGIFSVGRVITMARHLEVERVPNDEAIFLALGEE